MSRLPMIARTTAVSFVAVAGLLRVANAQESSITQAPEGWPAVIREMPTDVDATYVEMMRLHYSLGLDMARLAAQRASRDELRLLASRRIEDDQRELNALAEVGLALRAPDVATYKRGDDPDTESMLERLRASSGKNFDLSFLVILIAHDDQAIQLSKNVLRFQSPQVRSFAQRVGERRAREVKELRLMQRGS